MVDESMDVNENMVDEANLLGSHHHASIKIDQIN